MTKGSYAKSFVFFWIKIANSEKLSIIRTALTLSLPVVIAGAAAVLINNFPVPIYQELMLRIFGEGWRTFGGTIWNGTLAVLSPVMAFSIGYSIVERWNLKNPQDAVHPVISGLLSFCCLLLLTESSALDWAIPYNWVGVNGLFLGIVVSIISSELFLRFYRIRRLRLNFISEDAGITITYVFAALVPSMLTFSVFSFLKIFMTSLGYQDIHALIYRAISLPFKDMGNTLPTALLYNLARNLLWFFGIHGANALEPVMTELYIPAMEANQAAIALGEKAPFIFTKTFFDTYISMGGAGNTLSLLIALFAVRGQNSNRRIAQISLFPAIFNINEPLLFGIPIVLNPIYFIPFIASPLVLTVISWGAVRLGILPVSGDAAEWTTPMLISGYVASGSIAGSLMQLFNLAVGFCIYLPFVHLAERLRRYRFNASYGEMIRAGKTGAGEVGAISQVLVNDLLDSIKKNEHSLLKNTPGVTFMLDLEMRFLQGSEKTAALLGFKDVQEMTGLSLKEIFSQAMPDSWTNDILKRCLGVLANLEPVDFEEKVMLNNGTETVFQLTITLAEEQDSVCRGVVIVMNDVSELHHAREEAINASRAKGAFLTNMSHEMRTPMNAIIGMTAIAKKSSDVKKKDYALDKIDEASAHLLGVINDILDMSKIEAGKLELSIIDFDFKKMIQKVQTVTGFRFREKGQHFAVRIDERIPPFLLGDDQRITQVIVNLLSNAVKFTPEGGSISLEADCAEMENGACIIRIAVSDTGIGIEKAQQEKLFTSFEQADSSTSRKFGGTGLGLAISKRIVELMGGRIWIESEPGKGSVFTFTIAVKEGKPIEAVETATVSIPDGSLGSFHILLAEDVEINREILLALLEPTGVAMDCAENGRQAVERFTANPDRYDLIFMDVQMPEMDGYEATRQIRAFEGSEKHVPIIAMTANVFREDIERCLAAGMNGHVGKPLVTNEVMAALSSHLGIGPISSDPQAKAPSKQ
ncbi:PTS transporter subunit EIIC [Leadbettera azotonutricia]|uniref:histidine kinase n=1 Tax=Leadbettera azotonutricia (strain ATCC BAA-888 / DSM 13862 / ZAS-9) TaxID=545695 RepID=F5Y8W7_LEAAZ|nr:PTS transporter subunit EIIC [Leadbettera azotonutricia]AEF81588.1 PAS domain protein [Leadbettera azotonutricia ZAS-9]